jgi:hypothetical protein
VAVRTEAATLLAPLPGLRLAPVRHHSPRCARHLRALMREFRPSHVLIEGPAELDALLPALQHAQARPPLAGYLHARVAVPQGEELHCRCYVPFAAFSPEWVALREATRLGAQVRFIDLPYGARLGQQARQDYFARSPEPTLTEEPVRRAPDAVAGLIAASGCRDFDEWWDRHFESGLRGVSADDYFAAVLGFCALLAGQGGGADPEDAAREAHMAAQVRAALAEGGRCLVVCGGMHVPGIVAGLDRAGEAAAGLSVAVDTGAHLIPYTLDRLERASGYAAGMPAPGYYQGVWQAWEGGAAQPDEAAWPAMAARLVQAPRERQQPASLPDAAEAVRLAHGLAALRGCHGGRAELQEALHSAVLRQGDDPASPVPRLAGLLGDGTHGRLPPNAPLAPLLADVQAFCTRHGLPVRPTLPVRKELDIYRSARHRRISQGLHRLRFLEVPYARHLAGPDFVAGTGLARVREIWSLGWEVETGVALTEAMRWGASLQEAAVGRLLATLAQTDRSGPAQCVLEILVMGLDGLSGQVLAVVDGWVGRSHDALALAQATVRLAQAHEAGHALGGEAMPGLPALLQRCYAQACLRLPWLGEGDALQQVAALDALADLHGMVCRAAPWADAALLHRACEDLHAGLAPARVRGAAAGILGMAGHWSADTLAEALRRMLGQAQRDAVLMGEYLQGFLRVARGWLTSHPPLLGRLSQAIAAWPEPVFLQGLPALRLAFAQLGRSEIRQLAERLVARPAAPAATAGPTHAEAGQGGDRALAVQVQALLQPWGLG